MHTIQIIGENHTPKTLQYHRLDSVVANDSKVFASNRNDHRFKFRDTLPSLWDGQNKITGRTSVKHSKVESEKLRSDMTEIKVEIANLTRARNTFVLDSIS